MLSLLQDAGLLAEMPLFCSPAPLLPCALALLLLLLPLLPLLPVPAPCLCLCRRWPCPRRVELLAVLLLLLLLLLGAFFAAGPAALLSHACIAPTEFLDGVPVDNDGWQIMGEEEDSLLDDIVRWPPPVYRCSLAALARVAHRLLSLLLAALTAPLLL